MNEQILTIHDTPVEDDAFNYNPNYNRWIKNIFNKADELVKKIYATKIIRP